MQLLLQLCQTFCHSQAIVANCSCQWPEYFIPQDILANNTEEVRACDITSDSADKICKTATIKQLDTLER